MRQKYEDAIASQREMPGKVEANVGADSAFTWAAPERGCGVRTGTLAHDHVIVKVDQPPNYHEKIAIGQVYRM